MSFNRDPLQTRFGDLQFRGRPRAQFKSYGVVFGIHIEPDGSHFIATTDRGSWVRGLFIGTEFSSGIADAEIAPILERTASRLQHGCNRCRIADERDGTLYIGIERVEKIVQFDYRHAGPPCTWTAGQCAVL